ncbi:ribonuclease HIII [Halalkalibacterium halodurans]|nr:ribonuclease HIII [Halalkalibacterium halodurans]
MLEIDSIEEIIGTDESGKGDYFGPLVVAGVFVNSETYRKLKNMGVMDSKKLGDDQIKFLAGEIKKICPYSLVVIGNEKYNELYERIENLNKLLAWGHARTIENILQTVSCNFALSDKFGDEKFIKKALLEKGKEITLFQRTKAESNIAVAAASILARDEFVNRLHRLSIKYNH